MERLPFSFYFMPFSCLQSLEGTWVECRDALLHNYEQRYKFSEVGHRWMQLALLFILLGTICDGEHWFWCKFSLVVFGILLVMPATLMASVWWALVMMKDDLDRGLI